MLPYNPRSGSLERQMAVMGVGYLNSPQLRLRDVKRLNHIYTARLWRSQDFNPKTYSLFCNAFIFQWMNEWVDERMSDWRNYPVYVVASSAFWREKTVSSMSPSLAEMQSQCSDQGTNLFKCQATWLKIRPFFLSSSSPLNRRWGSALPRDSSNSPLVIHPLWLVHSNILLLGPEIPGLPSREKTINKLANGCNTVGPCVS